MAPSLEELGPSSGEVSKSFEDLLQELDDVRVRLLEQHQRELSCHARAHDAPSLWVSEAENQDTADDVPASPSLDGTLGSPPAFSTDQMISGPSGGSEAAHVESMPDSAYGSIDQNTTPRRGKRFVLLDSWKDKVPATKLKDFFSAPRVRAPASRASTPGLILSNVGGSSDEVTITSPGCLSMIVLHPQNPVVVAWTMFSLVLILYDTVTVPLYTFYKFEQFPIAILVMDWIARIFWTVDMVSSSVTGFYDQGYVELRLCKVFQAYLKSWFVFDILVVSTDWLVIVVTADHTALSALPVLRGLRFVRVLRLLRLGRLKHLINEVLLYSSDGVMILVVIMKLTIGLCISIHLVASIWVGVGTISSSGWVSQEPLMDSAPLSAQYLISVNWVVTQLHGTSSVHPHTYPEMLFQTVVLLGANAFVAIFVATTVQAMMALTDAQALQMQYVCRRYLRRRRVSPELSHKLQSHFGKTGVRSQATLQDSQDAENKLVESLPLFLQQQLYEEVRLPIVSSTRLFRTHGLSNYRLLRQLCCETISGVFMMPGELVFTHGDSCTRMLVVESGTSVYVPLDGAGEGMGVMGSRAWPSIFGAPATSGINRISTSSSVSQKVQQMQLHRGQALCEASLWTRWTNRGELSAQGDFSMFSLAQGDFASVVSNYEFCYMSALKYASCYLVWLNDRMGEDGVSDVMDAPRDLLEYAEMPIDTGNPFVFISHFKEEAGSDAALMDEGISRLIKNDPAHPAFRLEAPTFLDSNNLDDIRLLRSVVRSSHNLLLLLTDRVLERPWVLIEIVTAMKSGVPIQLVQIQRPGVDFRFPTEGDIKRLAAGKGLSSDAKSLLKAENITSEDLEAIGQIFRKIALPFSPHRSLTVRQAELKDIVGRCEFSERGHPPRQGWRSVGI